MEKFDVKELMKYISKAESDKETLKNCKGWLIRFIFMIKFGLNEQTIEPYISKLNALIENDSLIPLLGYTPDIITRSAKRINTIEEFEQLT